MAKPRSVGDDKHLTDDNGLITWLMTAIWCPTDWNLKDIILNHLWMI